MLTDPESGSFGLVPHLDWDVFVSIRNGCLIDLAMALNAGQHIGCVCAPYSPTHISQLTANISSRVELSD